MINTKAFNEQVVMISKDMLNNNLDSVVAIHIKKDGDVVSSYSVDVESEAEVFKLLGALETMKQKIMLGFVDFGNEIEDDE